MKNLILASIAAVGLMTLAGCADDSAAGGPNGVSGTGNSVQGSGGGTTGGGVEMSTGNAH